MSGKSLPVVILVAALWVGVASAETAQAERGLNVGDVLPARTLKTLNAGPLPFPAPEGLTVLLFWSTWSPRSEPALALWKQFQEDYRGNGVRILTVNADHQTMTDENRQEVGAFIQARQVTLPVHQDEGLEFYNEIGVMVLPTLYFIKPDGTISYKYPGFPSSAALDLKEDLEKALGVWVEPKARAGEAAAGYQPKNNALLYFNLGLQLHRKGQLNTAEGRYIEALKRDPGFAEPLRGLEAIYFRQERNALTEGALTDLLLKNGLDALVGDMGKGEPMVIEVEKKTDPQLRMRQLLDKSGGASQTP